MKTYFHKIILLLIFSTSIIYQSYAGVTLHQYKGYKTITSSFQKNIEDSKIDPVGNVYIVGNFVGNTLTIGSKTINGSSTLKSGFIAKFAPDGQCIWAKSIIAGGDAAVNSLALDKSMNIYITGAFTGPFGTFPDVGNIMNNGNDDIFIAKFNQNGVCNMAKAVGGTGNDAGFDIEIDNNDNIWLSGFVSNTVNFTGIGNKTANAQDGFIAKISAAGTFLWVNLFGGIASLDYVKAISADNNGNVFGMGLFSGFNVAIGSTLYSTVSLTLNDIFVVSCGPSGNVLWSKAFSSTNNDICGDIAVVKNGIMLTGGFSSSTSIQISTTDFWIPQAASTMDIFVINFSNNGLVVNSNNSYGGSNTDYGTKIVFDNDKNAYITGSSNSATFTFGPNTFNNYSSSFDSYLMNVNTETGAENWLTYLEGPNDESGKTVAYNAPLKSVIWGVNYQSTYLSAIGLDPIAFSTSSTDIFLTRVTDNTEPAFSPIGGTFCQGQSIEIRGDNLNQVTSAAFGTHSATILTPRYDSLIKIQLDFPSTATDTLNLKSSSSVYIKNVLQTTVNPKPTFAWTGVNTKACTGTPIAILANGTGKVYYKINSIKDSINNFTGSINIPYTPSFTGNLTIKGMLKDANGCFSDSILAPNIVVYSKPTSFAISGATKACINSSIMLNISPQNPSSIYNWVADNGANISGTPGKNPIFTLINAGKTKVAALETDVNGCKGDTVKWSFDVQNLPTPPVVTSPISYCKDAATSVLTATVSPKDTLQWWGTDPTGGTWTKAAILPSSSVVGTTSYYVSQKDSLGCESNRSKIDVIINSYPIASFNYSNVKYCKDDANPIPSFIGGGVAGTFTSALGLQFVNPSTGQINLSLSTPGNYTVTNTVMQNGCISTKNFNVAINPTPIITANATKTAVCQGQSVTLTGGGGMSYIWDNSVTDGTAFIPTSTKSYFVIGTDFNGCKNTASKTITVNAKPAVTANPTATSICTGNSVTLHGGGANTYSWDNAVTNATPFNPTSTQTYTVTGTDGNGCTNTASITITVNSKPVISASNVSICEGSSTTLNASGAGAGGTYLWVPAINLSANNIENPVANPSSTTTYILNGTDINGCTGTANVKVTVLPKPTATLPNDIQEVCEGNDANLKVTLTGKQPWAITYSGSVTITGITTSPYNFNITPSGSQIIDILQVSDDNTCTSTGTGSTSINFKVKPKASISGSTSICNGASTDLNLIFTGTPPFAFIYSDGGTPISVSGISSFSYSVNVSPTSTKSYSLISFNDAGSCNSMFSGSATITVNNNPLAPSILPPGVFCENGATYSLTATPSGSNTLLWWGTNISGGTSSTVATNPSTTTPGIFNYYVSQKDINGCESPRAAIKVKVNPKPSATMSGDTSICSGSNTVLKLALSGVKPWSVVYNANGINQTINGINTSPYTISLANPSAQTASLVSIKDSSACLGNTNGSAQIFLKPIPTVTISNTDTICKGDTSINKIKLTFTGNPNWNITYSDGSILSTINNINSSNYYLTLSPNATSTYTINTITSNGCTGTSSGSASIVVNEALKPDFDYNTPICINDVDPLPVFKNGGIAGKFSSDKAGLIIDDKTGKIDLLNSTAGTYQVSNIISVKSCPLRSYISAVNITAPPIAKFSYSKHVYCKTEANPSPQFTTGATLGVISSGPGLSISSGGVINLAGSTVGKYKVINSVEFQNCVKTNRLKGVHLITDTFEIEIANTCVNDTIISLNATTDTYINNTNSSLNYNTSNTLYVGNNSGTINRVLLHFDLTSIPNDVEITSAKLILSQINSNFSGNPTLEVHQLNSKWDNSNVTWNSSGFANWTSVGADFSTTVESSQLIKLNDFGQVDRIDLTSSVQNIIAGTSLNNGWLIKVADETLNNYISYGATNNSIEAFNPVLEITYRSKSLPIKILSTSSFQSCFDDSTGSIRVVTDLTSTTDSLIYLLKGPSNRLIKTKSSNHNFLKIKPGIYEVIVKNVSNNTTDTVSNISVSKPEGTKFNLSKDICLNDKNPVPSFILGNTAGKFSSTTGLVFISELTGEIDLKKSLPGLYKIVNTRIIAGCNNITDTVEINLHEIPTATLTGSGAICAGESKQLTLTLTGEKPWKLVYKEGSTTFNTTINTSPYLINLKPTVATNYSIDSINNNFCKNTSTSSATISVNTKPSISASASKNNICNGELVTLSGNGASSYNWDKGITDQLAFSPSVTETYTLVGVATNGCKDTVSININVKPKPIITATGGSFCESKPGVTISANGAGSGGTYVWSPTNFLSDPTIASPTANPKSNTTYKVMVTTIDGCKDSSSVDVIVNKNPNVKANTSIAKQCQGLPVTLNGSGASTYIWDNSVIDGVAFNAVSTQKYTVTGTDLNGCQATDTITVSVQPSGGRTSNATIVSNGAYTNCKNNTLKIKITNPESGQIFHWYRDGKLIMNESIDSITAFTGGTYTLNTETCYPSNSITIASSQFGVMPSLETTKAGNKIESLTVNANDDATIQWYLNDYKLSGATNKKLPISFSGHYKAAVSTNGCSIFSKTQFVDSSQYPSARLFTILVNDSTIILDNAHDLTFVLVPNPTQGIVQISGTQLSSDEYTVIIKDITGNAVFESKGNLAQNKTLHLESLPTGLYLIEIQVNHRSSFSKLLKQD